MDKVSQVEAEPREEFGKNAARRLRRGGRIPGVLYGGGGPAIPVAVDPKTITHVLGSEAGHNALFTLQVRGRAPARVMLRDWLVDPVNGKLLHIDLVRVALDTQLKVKVPIHIVGEPKGVKVQGGILEFVTREVEVECLPEDIPDHVTVDVTELMIGRNLRVSDVPLGDKVKVLTDPTRVVAHVVAPKAEEEKPAEVAEAAPAEPELIRKGKAEEEGGEKEEAGAEKAEKAEKGEKKEGKREPKKESKKES
ncbi:MAG: 50S ribosomal protein L25 [Acidobacteria bacterium]|nr:MAG: 50S ribosomal protein L25 [Acidobacteriota bacterium]